MGWIWDPESGKKPIDDSGLKFTDPHLSVRYTSYYELSKHL
jgi:hypothetical protein